MKVLIGINNLTSVQRMAYANHCQFWFRLGRQYPNDDFGFCNPERMTIDHMRNFAAKAAMELDFDYLMFVDDDVLLPFEAFKKLYERNVDVVAGVTLIRGYPYHPMIFDFLHTQLTEDKCHYVDNYKERCDKTGLLECDAVGFSCCLIKVSVLRALWKSNPMPFFITGENHTEDIFFCGRVKKELSDIKIYCDTTVETAHILGTNIIEPSNKDAKILFDETLDPTLKRDVRDAESRVKLFNPAIIRAVDYPKMVKEKIWG